MNTNSPADRLADAKAHYSRLANEERKLDAFVESVGINTDYRELARSRAELAALRDIMGIFPEEVRQGYISPYSPEAIARAKRIEKRQTLRHNIGAWGKQIESEEQHEIPALEAKLTQPPPAHVLAGVSIRYDHGAPQRAIDLYYRNLREQIAAKVAHVAELKQKIADGEEELKNMAAKENSVA